jgi:hypothetical protein
VRTMPSRGVLFPHWAPLWMRLIRGRPGICICDCLSFCVGDAEVEDICTHVTRSFTKQSRAEQGYMSRCSRPFHPPAHDTDTAMRRNADTRASDTLRVHPLSSAHCRRRHRCQVHSPCAFPLGLPLLMGFGRYLTAFTRRCVEDATCCAGCRILSRQPIHCLWAAAGTWTL